MPDWLITSAVVVGILVLMFLAESQWGLFSNFPIEGAKVLLKTKAKVVDSTTPTIIDAEVKKSLSSDNIILGYYDVSLNGVVLTIHAAYNKKHRSSTIDRCYLKLRGELKEIDKNNWFESSVRKCLEVCIWHLNAFVNQDKTDINNALKQLSGAPVVNNSSLSPAVNQINMDRGLSRLTGEEKETEGVSLT